MKHLFEKYKIYGFRKFLRFFINELFYNRIWLQIVKKSFAQKGEDFVIDKLLGNKKKGFYVDVGAYDPCRFSNTKRFYSKGWRGINIEPNQEGYKRFLKNRSRDINLNLGVGKKSGFMVFYKMFPPTLSSFSLKEIKQYQKKGYKLVKKLRIPVSTLFSILSKYAKNKKIDFISIDTEGFDLAVLEGNDWNKFRPRIVCIETSRRISENSDNKLSFLKEIGYKIATDNGLNTIFIDTKNDK